VNTRDISCNADAYNTVEGLFVDDDDGMVVMGMGSDKKYRVQEEEEVGGGVRVLPVHR
jgi:hypothetical protein